MDPIDNTLLAASTAGLLADWGQTREIRDNPKFREMNPLLGDDAKYVDLYFPAMIAGNYFGGKNLTPLQRKLLWAAVTAIQAKTVHGNNQIGIGFKF